MGSVAFAHPRASFRIAASSACSGPYSSPISRFIRLASAGLAPAVEIAIAIGPVRTIAGRMKLQSGGTSTTLHSIERRSASSKTAMFDVGVRGRGDREEVALEIARRERPLRPLDVAGGGQRLTPSHASGAITCTLGVAGQQPLDLLEPDVARADDQAPAPGQLQAGDVERRVAACRRRSADRTAPAGAGTRTASPGRPERAWSDGSCPPVRGRSRHALQRSENELVSAVMSARLLTTGPADTLVDAAHRMADRRVGAILVVEGDHLIGILTERDVLRAVGRGTIEGTVEQWMTRRPDTVAPDATIGEAAAMMVHGGFRHVPDRRRRQAGRDRLDPRPAEAARPRRPPACVVGAAAAAQVGLAA